MKPVELYARVRHEVLIEGYSSREVARLFGTAPPKALSLRSHFLWSFIRFCWACCFARNLRLLAKQLSHIALKCSPGTVAELPRQAA